MSEDNVLPFVPIPLWLAEVVEVLREDQRTEADLAEMRKRALEIPKLYPFPFPQEVPRSLREPIDHPRIDDPRSVRGLSRGGVDRPF